MTGSKSTEAARALERVKDEIAALLGLTGEDAHRLVSGAEVGAVAARKDLALVGLDADGVQSQVFASPRPVNIQGASARIRDFDDRLRRGDLLEGLRGRCPVLYAGGGQATLLTTQDLAPVLSERLVSAYSERTGGRATSAQLPLSGSELVDGPKVLVGVPEQIARKVGLQLQPARGFGGCVGALAARMRLEKLRPSRHAFLEGPQVGPRCAECGLRPRVAEKLCTRCAENRGRGGKEKHAQARTYEDVVRLPNGRRARLLAFVVIDGKGIGGVLQRLRTVEQYVAVSTQLELAFEPPDADLAALLGLPAENFQVPIRGGDDLMLVLPATWDGGDVFTATARLLRRVEERFSADALGAAFRRGDARDTAALERLERVGAGAGIFVTTGLPAGFCFDYAGELCDASKAGIQDAHRSAIDFLILRSGSPLSREALHAVNAAEKQLDLPGLRGTLQLTRRPYGLSDYEELLARVRKGKKVSRSTLYGLRNALEVPNVGMVHLAYQLARHPELRPVFLETEHDTPPSLSKLGPWVLKELEHGWATPIPDILDLARVVR